MLVTNFLSLNPSSYNSSHYKQDSLITKSKLFHFLFQDEIVKQDTNVHLKSVCDYEFQTLQHRATFIADSVRSKENLSIPATTQEYLEYAPLLRFVD